MPSELHVGSPHYRETPGYKTPTITNDPRLAFDNPSHYYMFSEDTMSEPSHEHRCPLSKSQTTKTAAAKEAARRSKCVSAWLR